MNIVEVFLGIVIAIIIIAIVAFACWIIFYLIVDLLKTLLKVICRSCKSESAGDGKCAGKKLSGEVGNMPKYRGKMRLKRYLAKNGTVSPLIEHLLLTGCKDSEVRDVERNGIEAYVADWEDIIEWIPFNDTSEEYLNDISIREKLHDVMQYAGQAEIEPFKERILGADARFKELTVETASSLDVSIDNKEMWWLFRWPKQKN